MTEYIQTLNGKDFKSIYVVGDLHGAFSLLMNKLISINFDFEHDLLICTGDLVDRGNENLECISLVDKSWFRTVRGNHEEMCIKGQSDPNIRNIHERNGGEWFYKQSTLQQLNIINSFKNLPLVIELDLEVRKIGIVHADIDIHEWKAFKEDISKGDYNISGITSAYTNALWGRGRIKNYSEAYDVVENIDEIYLGHTIVKEIIQLNNCFYIDVGSSFTKELCIKRLK